MCELVLLLGVASISPSLEASFFASTSVNSVVSPHSPQLTPPPRSGCLTTAAAVQECLPYNVTHISKRDRALLPLCKEPPSPRCSLSALSLFFRTGFSERHSLIRSCFLLLQTQTVWRKLHSETYNWLPVFTEVSLKVPLLQSGSFYFLVLYVTRIMAPTLA